MRRLLAGLWSAEGDARLVDLWMNGRPAARIARKLHHPLSSVYTRTAGLGLPKRLSLLSPPIAPNPMSAMPRGMTRLLTRYPRWIADL
jgi:hypothetical protein